MNRTDTVCVVLHVLAKTLDRTCSTLTLAYASNINDVTFSENICTDNVAYIEFCAFKLELFENALCNAYL